MVPSRFRTFNKLHWASFERCFVMDRNWEERIRTFDPRIQIPVLYRLATSHCEPI